MTTQPFSKLRDRILSDPVKAERLIAAIAELNAVYTETLHPEDDEPGYVGKHRRE